jgi:hypothetical protein
VRDSSAFVTLGAIDALSLVGLEGLDLLILLGLSPFVDMDGWHSSPPTWRVEVHKDKASLVRFDLMNGLCRILRVLSVLPFF